MVKKLLSLVTVLVAFCSLANAQKLQKYEKAFPHKYNNVMMKAPATRASTDGVVFTYAYGSSIGLVGGGNNYASHYDCAIFVPGKFAGNKIDIIASYIVDRSCVGNVKCWIADQLPTTVNASTCDYIIDVTVTGDLLTTGEPFLAKPENYTIPEGGCYVGYSFDVTDLGSEYGLYPVAFDGGDDIEGGAFMNMTIDGEDTGWDTMYGFGSGNLLTMIQLSGDNFLSNAVTLNDTDFKVVATKDGKANVRLSVKNLGVNDISSLSYTVKDVTTGEVSEENTVTLDEPAMFYEMADVTFQAEAGSETGSFNKEITITKVNGQANEGNESVLSATGSLLIVSRNVAKKIVVEEFTGTGCPNCPRGYAGMAALADTYPDEFIGISPHVSVNYEDPMETVVYDDMTGYFQANKISLGVPSALLNRTGNMYLFDPYYGSGSAYLGILDGFEALRGAAEAEVAVSPQWNENQTEINVNTDVTFLYNRDDAPYALAYVLLSDGLQGSEYYWWQYNGSSYMYGNMATGESYLDAWLTKGEVDEVNIPGYGSLQGVYVKDMVYDHVALASQNLMPTEPTLKAPIVMEEKQTATTTFDVSNGIQGYYLGNELIQDKSKLKVVAMLINTETGEIVNADEKEIAAYTTGIENITTEEENATEVARYSLDGTLLAAPTKGVNIVKMSDGTTRKVIVK